MKNRWLMRWDEDARCVDIIGDSGDVMAVWHPSPGVDRDEAIREARSLVDVAYIWNATINGVPAAMSQDDAEYWAFEMGEGEEPR